MGGRQPAAYVMASGRNGTLYVGVTSDLVTRVAQHRSGEGRGFTARHGCTMLVFYELHGDMTAAITREKQLKAGSRAKKLMLIEVMNPQWRDLYADILGTAPTPPSEAEPGLAIDGPEEGGSS